MGDIINIMKHAKKIHIQVRYLSILIQWNPEIRIPYLECIIINRTSLPELLCPL